MEGLTKTLSTDWPIANGMSIEGSDRFDAWAAFILKTPMTPVRLPTTSVDALLAELQSSEYQGCPSSELAHSTGSCRERGRPSGSRFGKSFGSGTATTRTYPSDVVIASKPSRPSSPRVLSGSGSGPPLGHQATFHAMPYSCVHVKRRRGASLVLGACYFRSTCSACCALKVPLQRNRPKLDD